jgi:hypothetical protein
LIYRCDVMDNLSIKTIVHLFEITTFYIFQSVDSQGSILNASIKKLIYKTNTFNYNFVFQLTIVIRCVGH